MKKNLLFAASILAIGGFLAACGSEETVDENTGSSPDQATEEVVDNETAEETPAEEAAEDSEAVEETDEANSEETEAPSDADSDTEEAAETDEAAEEPEAEGTVIQSPEQAYEMTVLPAYELTSEEPGKDSLFLTSDSSVFMRVETFSPDDIDFAYAEDIMKQTVQASSSEGELTEGAALQGDDFINSSVYEIPGEEGKVTGVVFEKEDLIVRLTIFDKTAVDATPDFIKMGQTIDSTN